jgi:hypothetical protein
MHLILYIAEIFTLLFSCRFWNAEVETELVQLGLPPRESGTVPDGSINA